jgi:hypothetical protein
MQAPPAAAAAAAAGKRAAAGWGCRLAGWLGDGNTIHYVTILHPLNPARVTGSWGWVCPVHVS